MVAEFRETSRKEQNEGKKGDQSLKKYWGAVNQLLGKKQNLENVPIKANKSIKQVGILLCGALGKTEL